MVDNKRLFTWMWKTFYQCLAGTIGEGLVTLLSVTFVDYLGSGCGSVGRAVASDARGLWFESSHNKLLYRTFI